MILKPNIIRWLFVSYVLLILLLVTLPLNTPGELNNITILQLRGDYFFHILMFLPWIFFPKALRINPTYWLILGVLIATVTEGVQYLLSWRAFNINDILANVLGVLIGSLLIIIYAQITKVNNPQKH